MKKVNVLYIVSQLVFLVLFNLIFFLVGGTQHPSSVWLSYVFIHFSYLMLIATTLLVKRSKSATTFGVTLYLIATIYFCTEFIVGIIFILLKLESIKLPLIFQVVIAGIYILMLLSQMIANEYTAENEEKIAKDWNYIKISTKALEYVMDMISDRATKKKVERLYDNIRSSQVVSHSNAYLIEQDIINQIGKLENAVENYDESQMNVLIDQIGKQIDKRNRILKV